MSEDHTHPQELDARALRCLRHIASGCDGGLVSPLDPDCSSEVMQRLESLGLIECGSSSWMPLETKHALYRVTQRGAALLRDSVSS